MFTKRVKKVRKAEEGDYPQAKGKPAWYISFVRFFNPKWKPSTK